jgi:deoxyadenosine/deoxycytidine kinase
MLMPNNIQNVHPRIEICGGIASGKTTFATLLSRIGFDAIYESFATNPFWNAFYADPTKYAFETEITFTLQHYHQIKMLHEEGKKLVCDYSFLLDTAYAEMGLNGSKLNAFKNVYEEIRKELPTPALVIHLQCDPKTELTRIRERGRDVVNTITVDFLRSLNKAVIDQINFVKNDLTIITIDSARNNFVDDENVKNQLLQLLDDALSQRKG